MTEELKPCPFCGGEGKPELIHADVHMWYVKCTKCGACCEGVQLSAENAVEVWNRRRGRTCTMRYEGGGGRGFPKLRCSECGAPKFGHERPRYCPSCGAKVVD